MCYKLCERSVCDHCTEHRTHLPLDVKSAYEIKQQQHRGIIHIIKSEAVFYRHAILAEIKADVKTCRKEFSIYQSEMLKQAKRIKDRFDNVLRDVKFKHSCLKQIRKISRHIAIIKRYEYIYEQSAIRPVQFITKKTIFSQFSPHLIVHSTQLSMTESLNKEDVLDSLGGIQITERGKRLVGNKPLLKLMSNSEVHQSLTVKDVRGCIHVSYMKPERVLVSDRNNLILTNVTGATLYHIDDLYSDDYCGVLSGGLHTVSYDGEIIYIDMDYKITKIS